MTLLEEDISSITQDKHVTEIHTEPEMQEFVDLNTEKHFAFKIYTKIFSTKVFSKFKKHKSFSLKCLFF